MYSNENILEAITRITDIANKSRLGINSKLQRILEIIVSSINTRSGSIMLLKGRHNLEVAASTNKDIIGIKQPLDDVSRSAWVVKNKKTLFYDLLKTEIYRKLIIRPEIFRTEVTTAADSGINHVIVDEVQRVPQILNEIHHLIESEINTFFILSGSSARKLKRSNANLE